MNPLIAQALSQLRRSLETALQSIQSLEAAYRPVPPTYVVGPPSVDKDPTSTVLLTETLNTPVRTVGPGLDVSFTGTPGSPTLLGKRKMPDTDGKKTRQRVKDSEQAQMMGVRVLTRFSQLILYRLQCAVWFLRN